MARKPLEISFLKNEISHDSLWRDFVAAERPVVLRGAIKHWPAIKKWNLPSLNSALAHKEVALEDLQDHEKKYDPGMLAKWSVNRTQTTFSDVLSKQKKDADFLYFLGAPHVFEKAPQLLSDVDLSLFQWGSRRRVISKLMASERPCLTIAPPTSCTPIHYDNFHNFVFQIEGRKTWIILDREDKPKLGLPSKLAQKWMSPINALEPDLKLFPIYNDLPRASFDLEKGDALFVPRNFPHFVLTNDFSINLNIWFPVWSDLFSRDNLKLLTLTLRQQLKKRLAL